CAVDTSGAVSWQSFETVLPHTDLFLYDVKQIDEQIHREHTGSGNGMILENLTRLAESGVPIEVRIPLIPGFNANQESLSALGKWLSRMPNIAGVRLLPYHLARSKYETVGRRDTMPHVPLPTPEQVREAAAVLEGWGLEVGR